MNLIEQMAYHLEFLGFGTVSDHENDGNIFWGTMPDQPDDAIVVYSTDSGCGGEVPARLQITVRSKKTRKAYELSQAIVEELFDFDGFLNGDGRHVYIKPLNSSHGLGADGRKRELYASNFLVYYCNY